MIRKRTFFFIFITLALILVFGVSLTHNLRLCFAKDCGTTKTLIATIAVAMIYEPPQLNIRKRTFFFVIATVVLILVFGGIINIHLDATARADTEDSQI